jgi:hypothetical protein
MEEKAHFKHEANIKLTHEEDGKHTTEQDGNYTISRILHLQPMAVKWENDTGGKGVTLVCLDFYEEIVYSVGWGSDLININDTNLGSAVLEVLKQKKTNAQKSSVPKRAIDDILNSKKKSEEERPNAREF